MGSQLQGRVRGTGGRRGHRPMSEINVTPFVDVMLVLLVVFMITAPLLTAGVQVDLPKSQSKSLSQQDNAPFEITVNRKGNVFVGKTKMTKERLMAVLTTMALETPDKRIYIRADQKLSYGSVMKVMGYVNHAGLTHVALVSDPNFE